MTWYAIRTSPGAQLPQREYATETTALGKDGQPRGKGYRIVPSLNPNMSAVEKALKDKGFTCYMPADFKVVRSRKKANSYTLRRFPLLPGYLFVHDIRDWEKLEKVPGVAGWVHVDGKPLALSVTDFLLLRTVEAKNQAAADQDLARRANDEKAVARKATLKAAAQAKKKLYAGKRVKVLWGKDTGHEAVVAGWADDEQVRVIFDRLEAAESTVSFDALKLVA